MPPSKKKKSAKAKKEELTFKKKVVKFIDEHKNRVFSFKDRRWSIAVLLATLFFAFFIQSLLEAKMNPETVQANIAQVRSSAREAFKISNTFDIINTEKNNEGHYIALNDIDIDVFSFGIQSNDKTIVLKEVIITKVGNIDDKALVRAKLYEGENAIAQTRIKNGKFLFNEFASVLQPNSYKEYIVKLDTSDKAHSGDRFKFEISSPYDIVITLDDQPIYKLDTYPISGAFVTFVGWRK